MTRFVLLSFAALFLAGCHKPDEIKHYEVTFSGPRPPAKPPRLPDDRGDKDKSGLPEGHPTLPDGHPPIDSAAGGVQDNGAEGTEKTMLAAFVPVGEQGWTFKVTGPVAALGKFAEPFEIFVESVKFKGAGPSWKLPVGWTEAAGGGQFRFATLHAKLDDQDVPPLEITVSQVALTPDYLLANVNRWRGQMGLDPITADELPKETKTLKLSGDLSATAVKLTGKPKAGMGRPPFAPGGGNGQ